MKKCVVYFLWVISFLVLSLKHSYAQHHGKIGKTNRDDSVTLIKLENDWTIALVDRDEKLFRQLLADDFFYTENEKMYSREEVIESSMSVTESVYKSYNEDMQVRLKGETGIVTGWLYVNGKDSVTDFHRKYRFTDVWYKKSGNWQLIAAQDYLLPFSN